MTYKPKAGEKLVGRRIAETTPLGQQLAKLRELYTDAAKIDPHTKDRLSVDALNASLRVRLDDGIERDRRKRAIRKQLEDAIYAAELSSGVTPVSIGVPKAFLDEARAALVGSKYDGIKVTVEK